MHNILYNIIMRNSILLFASYGIVLFIRDIIYFKHKFKPNSKPDIIHKDQSESDDDLLIIDSDSDDYDTNKYTSENMIRKRRRTEQN